MLPEDATPETADMHNTVHIGFIRTNEQLIVFIHTFPFVLLINNLIGVTFTIDNDSVYIWSYLHTLFQNILL